MQGFLVSFLILHSEKQLSNSYPNPYGFSVKEKKLRASCRARARQLARKNNSLFLLAVLLKRQYEPERDNDEVPFGIIFCILQICVANIYGLELVNQSKENHLFLNPKRFSEASKQVRRFRS